jgi:hypothetical protein
MTFTMMGNYETSQVVVLPKLILSLKKIVCQAKKRNFAAFCMGEFAPFCF